MQDGNIVTQVFLPLSLAFIMFSLGLALVTADFKRVLVQPKDFIIGAISQVIVLPAIAFGLVSVWTLEPALAVGVMILAASPGGVTSNLMTHLAKGDTALSVSLTAVISLLGVVTLPVIVGFAITNFMGAAAPDISVVRISGGVFAITVVPVIIGMAVRHFWTNFAIGFERWAKIIASVLFAVIIIGAVLSVRDNIVAFFVQAGPITLALNVVMMAVAFFIANITGLGVRQRTAITLECGLQNGTLTIFVAVTLIGNQTMMVPGGIYSLLMFVTAGIYLLPIFRRDGGE
ncbi:MAG: bile acid:sodium symporter family protein [Rhodospirillaceae bacterium]|jgi:BASS family bile acid:Na+ symporter|nr:bile acid:sodium symporter family protein [Rhodospirillaceae bacterium]MBT3884901.1 bile acid:sodium symporter family protein [Rhodospirillaceae bacterium]MBT4116775.1 bile acid:sodium symporter family protein [Rhodospirillaceae bacterium]MBT4674222.1 bile acid:sodium symporter family protein [Rhodospirillaceae bacterium]MBT4720901.1 bile acid:sodium symporter family protein [Rhodospirillaceae bacterium]